MSLFVDNSEEFDINNAKLKIIDNNPYYVLPEETKIYYGSKSDVFDKQATFFGFVYQTAKKYGFVKTRKTNRELRLLALMELTPKHSFYKNADKKWKTKIESGFSVGKEAKYRISEGDYDSEMMRYLCNQNMDGYAMNGLYKGDKYGDFFHAELVLCNPTEDSYLIDKEDHKAAQSYTPPRGPSKSTRPQTTSPDTTPTKHRIESNLFNYSSPDTTPTKPNLFNYSTPGGKGKNKKTKRKLRKSKKSKRKQRKTRRK